MHDNGAPLPRAAREALEMLESAGIRGRAFLRFGEPCLSLAHGRAFLVVSLSGAQILEWSPRECNNPLWTTDESLHVPGTPIRGGIPLCWPWFGAAQPPFDGPSHGVARRLPWTLVAARAGTDAVILHLRLEISGDGHHLRADYHVRAGEDLALRLLTTNLGDTTCPVTPAFHPYFSVGDVTRTRLHFDTAVRPKDRIRGHVGDATRALAFTGEEQELQWSPWTDLVLESSAGSRLVIRSDSATHCVAWNPGAAKTAAIADLHAGAFREFVCVEPARLDHESSMIPPGNRAELSMMLCREN